MTGHAHNYRFIAIHKGKLWVHRDAIAVPFLLAHPTKILPILGTNRLGRISSISHANKVSLYRQDWFSLHEVKLGQEVA